MEKEQKFPESRSWKKRKKEKGQKVLNFQKGGKAARRPRKNVWVIAVPMLSGWSDVSLDRCHLGRLVELVCN